MMLDDEKKVLDQLDIQSAAWIKVRDALEEKLDALRKSNDTRGRKPEDTEFIRGKIALVKEILAWGNLTPDRVAEDEEHLS